MKLTLLYRGPLASCNYGCAYCPFAKHAESAEEREADTRALERFIKWVECRTSDRLSVFFTPWGEALIHPRYQEALVRLSHAPHIEKAAIQTNLSGSLEWVERCNRDRLALWTTYHPSQVSQDHFLAQCRTLSAMGARYSVGMVGLKDYLDEIEVMRSRLPAGIYLWVNAYKRRSDYYSPEDLRRLNAVDPYFAFNARAHPSAGRACLAGESVVSVDGDGVARRCHFIAHPIGNLYDADFEKNLRPRPCTNGVCGCHIGYVHMPELKLAEVFGEGLLARIPTDWPLPFVAGPSAAESAEGVKGNFLF